ncbi:MAG TPA: RNA degradosome polyphosphate kinase [Actinomycetota bacterium]|nr:RNA degradosome polyphosphate kinase [Actinomycetota bacterium]
MTPAQAAQGLACDAETCKAERRRTQPRSRTAVSETASAPDAVERDLHDPYLYINREISWLQFNDRVLAMAADPGVPLLERLKYLAIFSTNLDEFFMVRVSGLRDQVEAGIVTRGSDGWTPSETLEAITKHVGPSIERQVRVFLDEVVPAMAEAGIRIADIGELGDQDLDFLRDYFQRQVFPVLTPLAVDPSHPFPYISNLSLSLAVTVRDPGAARDRFARVKVPGILPRFVPLGDGSTFVPLEQVVATHLDRLFPGMDVVSAHPFRVSRDADIELAEDEADDLLLAVEQELRRQRFGQVVRLEVAASMPDHVVRLLQRELDVEDDAVVTVEGPLNLGDLMQLVSTLDRPELADDPWVGTTQPRLLGTEEDSVNLFATLREGDLLVHHPYDAFATSVQRFIEQAADDPDVLAIKQTLYRTDGDSPIVNALIQAAESGKQVVVMVEVKARGDEASNIGWARALERAGTHVAYGLVGLKTHSKTALVVRREHGGIRRYVHIGTGNYNAKTARLYTDLGLLSCDEDLGADLTELFNSLTGYARGARYRKILVAPNFLRKRVVELIGRTAERHGPRRPGRITMQMNALVDAECIRALYQASQAGVEIDLVVRGICRLRPGVPGVSDNIRVRSVVGRFLEHSRIWTFANGRRREYYIGSADLMPRNLDLRVEVVTPVTDPDLTGRLQEILDVMLADNVQAWELLEDGSWQRLQPAEGERRVATQKRLRELALRRGVEARSGGKRDQPA